VLLDVGILFVVTDVGTWFRNTSMRLDLHAIEVSSYWLLKPLCWVVDVVL
jgi:hypothetical protein